MTVAVYPAFMRKFRDAVVGTYAEELLGELDEGTEFYSTKDIPDIDPFDGYSLTPDEYLEAAAAPRHPGYKSTVFNIDTDAFAKVFGRMPSREQIAEVGISFWPYISGPVAYFRIMWSPTDPSHVWFIEQMWLLRLGDTINAFRGPTPIRIPFTWPEI